jgi:hypothetical protein
MAMTAREFEARYAEKCGVTVRYLREKRQAALPCRCGEPGCQGWQMRALPDIPEQYEWFYDLLDDLVVLCKGGSF